MALEMILTDRPRSMRPDTPSSAGDHKHRHKHKRVRPTTPHTNAPHRSAGGGGLRQCAWPAARRHSQHGARAAKQGCAWAADSGASSTAAADTRPARRTPQHTCGHNRPESLGVPNLHGRRLLVDLDYPDPVAHAVRDKGRAEADKRAPGQHLHARRGLGQRLLELVVGEEPGEVAGRRGGPGTERAVEQHQVAGLGDLVREDGEAVGAFHLHHRLDRVQGRDRHAPHPRRHGSCMASGTDHACDRDDTRARTNNSTCYNEGQTGRAVAHGDGQRRGGGLQVCGCAGVRVCGCGCVGVWVWVRGTKDATTNGPQKVTSIVGRAKLVSSSVIPSFAAVSPKRESGPCTVPTKPRYRLRGAILPARPPAHTHQRSQVERSG